MKLGLPLPGARTLKKRPYFTLGLAFALGCSGPVVSTQSSDVLQGGGVLNGFAEETPQQAVQSYLESRGWSCSDGTCLVQAAVEQLPPITYSPVPPADRATKLPSATGNVGVVSAALSGPQVTVYEDTVSGLNMSEPYAAFYKTSGGTSSMHEFSNPQWNTLFWGCTKDYSSDFCQRTASVLNNAGDPSATMESVGTPYLHQVMLKPAGANQRDLEWNYASGALCDNNCSAVTWTSCLVPRPPGFERVDYPQIIYDRVHDRRYVVYNAFLPDVYGGYSSIVMTELPEPSAAGCPTAPAVHRLANCLWVSGGEALARGTFSASGEIVVVFHDFTSYPTPYYATPFDTDQNFWLCGIRGLIGFVALPASTCSGDSKPVYDDIGAGQSPVMATYSPSVAVDDTGIGSTWIAAMATASGNRDAVTQVFRSGNAGSSWVLQNTSSQTTVQPFVVFVRTPFSAVADRFHLITLTDTNGNQNSSTVNVRRWRSTDDGQTWNATTVSSAPFLPASFSPLNCYWGDYVAVAADRSKAGVFYGWSEPGLPGATIQGRLMDE